MRIESMRKVVALVCVLALALFALSACSSGKASEEGDQAGQSAPEATSVQTVTFPSSFFAEAPTAEQATAQLEALGCTDIVDNGDGTYTATLSADAYNKVVGDLYDQVLASISDLENGDTYPNIDKVTYNDGFSSVQVQLNTDMPGLEDTYALSAVGVPAATYQQVAGLPVGCQADLVLEDGTVQQSMNFPLQ